MPGKGLCYRCSGCGRCHEEKPPEFVPGRCFACGTQNNEYSVHCAKCGAKLAFPPGGALQLKTSRYVPKEQIK